MKKIALIKSKYYPEITNVLVESFKNANFEHQFEFIEYEVFGVSEIPYKFSTLSDVDGVAVFGCVIQGETYHHELINQAVFNKLMDLSIQMKLPLGYAILNVKNESQAKARVSRGKEAYEALSYALL